MNSGSPETFLIHSAAQQLRLKGEKSWLKLDGLKEQQTHEFESERVKLKIHVPGKDSAPLHAQTVNSISSNLPQADETLFYQRYPLHASLKPISNFYILIFSMHKINLSLC